MSAYSGPSRWWISTPTGSSQVSSKLITSGLTMWVDAANTSSYDGTSTWKDLSGNGNHITLVGSPTFSSANGGILQFNGADIYGYNSTLNYAGSSFTIIAGARYSGTNRGRVITSNSTNWLLGHWNVTDENYYAEGWITAVNGGNNSSAWKVLAATENFAADQRSFYVNGQSRIQNSSSGANGFNQLYISKSYGAFIGANNEKSNCEVSFIMVFNRVLTEAEVRQNSGIYAMRLGI